MFNELEMLEGVLQKIVAMPIMTVSAASLVLLTPPFFSVGFQFKTSSVSPLGLPLIDNNLLS